jgi:hypothetical protein
MKTTTSINRIILAAGLALGAPGLFAATRDTWIDQHLRAKHGTYVVAEPSSASRLEPLPAPPVWVEQHLQRKQGAYSRDEQTRLDEARNSVAFRSDPVDPLPAWVDVHRSVKQGH